MRVVRAIAISLVVLFASVPLFAHCDTVDGPVVVDAKLALKKGEITPVLKWVKASDEPEIRAAFQQTLDARKSGGAAAEVADRWFFETLVRVHRAGEGAPYTGLKPAGTDNGPAIVAGDKALETGSVEALEKLVLETARHGIHERFTQLQQLREHATHNIEAGRAYTAAYADFLHYVDRIYEDASTGVAAHSH